MFGRHTKAESGLPSGDLLAGRRNHARTTRGIVRRADRGWTLLDKNES